MLAVNFPTEFLGHLHLVLRAASFAADKHRFQRRKDEAASPYVNHCLRVAALIADANVDDPEVLAAALLHDTLEDTETTGTELEQQFGARVRSLVEAVTDDKALHKQERKRLQIEHAHALPPDAVPIKLADKIANIEDISASPPKDWSLERRVEYLDWAEAVVNNCPRVNSVLLTLFQRALGDARRSLSS
jgi:GTP diphosphokinase / guanosine-3',5'-bis(diphosphate) 3'-diphosphatase